MMRKNSKGVSTESLQKNQKREIVTMKISSRNVLEGTVKTLVHHDMHTEVTVELPGGQEIVSVVTNASAQRLGLTEGMAVHAIVRASRWLTIGDVFFFLKRVFSFFFCVCYWFSYVLLCLYIFLKYNLTNGGQGNR